jgi:hypothetical protein
VITLERTSKLCLYNAFLVLIFSDDQ